LVEAEMAATDEDSTRDLWKRRGRRGCGGEGLSGK